MNDAIEAQERLRSRIERLAVPDPNSGCWLWSGAVAKNGYGTMTVQKRTRGAHRVSYQAYVGEIPAGWAVDHRCKVRCCVNPAHLEAVTFAENNARSPRVKPLPDTCVQGHQLKPGNLYRSKWRRCAECARVMALASYHRNRKSKLETVHV